MWTVGLLSMLTVLPCVGQVEAGSKPPVSMKSSQGRWKMVAKYHSKSKAYQKKAELEACGYQACVEQDDDGCWCVYCRM